MEEKQKMPFQGSCKKCGEKIETYSLTDYGFFIGKHIQSCYRPERTGFEDAAEIETAEMTGETD